MRLKKTKHQFSKQGVYYIYSYIAYITGMALSCVAFANYQFRVETSCRFHVLFLLDDLHALSFSIQLCGYRLLQSQWYSKGKLIRLFLIKYNSIKLSFEESKRSVYNFLLINEIYKLSTINISYYVYVSYDILSVLQ